MRSAYRILRGQSYKHPIEQQAPAICLIDSRRLASKMGRRDQCQHHQRRKSADPCPAVQPSFVIGDSHCRDCQLPGHGPRQLADQCIEPPGFVDQSAPAALSDMRDQHCSADRCQRQPLRIAAGCGKTDRRAGHDGPRQNHHTRQQ